jgi:hypothetical protein
MSESVRVSLIFPRSGQQVYVDVSEQMAHKISKLSAGFFPNSNRDGINMQDRSIREKPGNQA